MTGERRLQTIKPILAIFLLLLLCPAASTAKYSGGSGEPNDPYRIATPNDLNDIGNHIEDFNKCFLMVNDINMAAYTGTQFNIIGDFDDSFTGAFDGNGHTISNFTWESNGVDQVGLFGYVGGYSTAPHIESLAMENAHVNAGDGRSVGVVVGYSYRGAITNCRASGCVSGGTNVGILAGQSHVATVSACSAAGTVDGVSYVGGLVGRNASSSLVLNCSATADVSGQENVGGLLGSNNGDLSNSFSTGSVTGEAATGGLIGLNGGDVEGCYSTASVVGTDTVGGLIGLHGKAVAYCYSAGQVSATTEVGGLIGSNWGGFVHACFWDVNSSAVGYSDGGLGKTTPEMQSAATFSGWGCTAAWTIDEPNDYPRLIWENRPGELLTKHSYAGGSGLPNGPYRISSAEDLHLLGAQECDWDKHFVLTNDIDLSSYDGKESRPRFNRIGHGGSAHYGRPFTGDFDGNGHAITNFTWESNDVDDVGIFGYIRGFSHGSPEPQITRLLMIDPNIEAKNGQAVGSIAGYLEEAIISDCCVRGGKVSGGLYVGGLLGHGWREYGDKMINRCFSTAAVSGGGGVGGLVGTQSGSKGHGSTARSWASGNVVGAGGVGGLVGILDGELTNCFSSSAVLGNEYVGGLVGCVQGYSPCYIEDSYSSGPVSGNDYVGGLVGGHYYQYARYVTSFWDSDLNPDMNGIGNAQDPNVIAKTTAEMMMQTTFTDAGWDFVGELDNGTDDIWRMCWDGGWYPRLAWQFHQWADFVCPDRVDFKDFSYLAARLGRVDCADSNNCDGADLDYSGAVDSNDVRILTELWLKGRAAPGELAIPAGVDFADYAKLTSRWLNHECWLEHNCNGTDLDFSGVIDWRDLKVLADHWLEAL
ncbi:MAG: GLUG motif-containing protein [Planctomycetota bacterium]|jgi:hypothetical protein